MEYFTEAQCQHLHWCFSYVLPEPDDEQRDQALLDGPDGYPYYYYSPNRPLCAPLRAGGVDAIVREKWLYSRSVLGAEQVLCLGLLPVDARAVSHLLIPYYEQVVPVQYQGDCWALYNPKMEGRGAIIAPSTRVSGMYQMTLFFHDGPSSHYTHPTKRDAILDAIHWKCTMPGPDLLDSQVFQWRAGVIAIN
jgi:hypothetical protein